MMSKVCFVAALALALAHTGTSQVVCDETTSCTGQQITLQAPDGPTTGAEFSATAASAAVNAVVNLAPKASGEGTPLALFKCQADSACEGATFLTDLTGPTEVRLACFGPHACRNAKVVAHETAKTWARCKGAHSCNGLDLDLSADTVLVQCIDHESCSGAVLRLGGSATTALGAGETALIDCNVPGACNSLAIHCTGPIAELLVECDDLASCGSLIFHSSCSSYTDVILICDSRDCKSPTDYTTSRPTLPATTQGVVTTPSALVCDQLGSEWLTTEYMPTLDVVASGFEGLDTFRIAFDHHRKYFDVVPTLNADGEVISIAEFTSTTGQNASECWDHYCITATWASVVANNNCHRENGAAADGFITFTCKLVVDSKETLDPIRSQSFSREVHNEIPYQVLFPKQTSASLGDLSAFQPPNVLAAIVRQEVDVQVANNLDVDVTVDLYTSTQWPFLLTNAAVVSTPTGIPHASFQIETVCVDPEAGDIAGAGDNANACNQVWRLKLLPDNGARSAPCELDGTYQVEFTAVCQPSFPSDCPLVKDDLGETNDVFAVTFKLDSEYFCPVVVETVDLSADLYVYKDHVHTVAATNFILGQRAYFRFVADSTEVTIASVAIDDIEVTGCDTVAGQVYTDKAFPAGALFPAAQVHIEDSAASPAPGLTVPDYEAWFDFPITNPPFDAPADGSCDFSVSATADVVFKDAALVALLGEAAPVRRSRYSMRLMQSGGRQQVATTTFEASTYDRDTSAAPRVGAAVVGAAAAAAVAAASLA